MTTFVQLKALGWTPQDFKRKKGATQEEIKREIFDALVAAHEDQSKGRNTISRNILTMPMIPSFGAGQTRRILS